MSKTPVNVRQFGAKGDGITNDAAALQAAINYAFSLPNGGSVYIPAGDYVFKTTLVIQSTTYKPLKIYGDGQFASILHFAPDSYSAGNSVGVEFKTGTGAGADWLYRMVARDFSVQCNRHARIGIRITHANQCIFENILSTAEQNWTPTTAEPLNTAYIFDVQTCSFSQIDLRPNSRGVNCQALVMSGSNTTTSFSDCWIHEASELAQLASVSGCQFNNCQFEDGDTGIALQQNDWAVFNNCWYESIGAHVFTVVGGNPATSQGANVVVNGGFYNPGISNGTVYYKSGYNNDGFILASNTNRIIVRDLDVYNSMGVALGQLVNIGAGTTNHSIQMDANTSFRKGPQTITAVAVDGVAITVTTRAASGLLDVLQPAHGYVVGDTIGLKGFAASPVSGLLINIPFYKVTTVVDVNNYRITPISTTLLTAAGVVNCGAGSLIKYNGDTWVNCIIGQPNRTLFNDAPTKEVAFLLTSAGATNDTPMLCDGDVDGSVGYLVTHWAYLMYGVLSTNIKEAATSVNYFNVFIDYPPDYDLNVQTTSQSGGVPTNEWMGPDVLIGLKIPPGTRIRVQHTQAAGGGVTYPRTRKVTLFVAVCNAQQT